MNRLKTALVNQRGDGMGQVIATILIIIVVVALIVGPFKTMGQSTSNVINTQSNQLNTINNAIKPGG